MKAVIKIGLFIVATNFYLFAQTNCSGKIYDYEQHLEGYKSILKLPDNTYLAGGSSWNYSLGYYHMLLSRLNACGDTIWSKNYGQVDEGFIDSRSCLIDEHTFANVATYFNYSISNDHSAYFVAKFNLLGDTIWTKQYAFLPNYIHVPKSIIKTLDGGFAILGFYYPPPSGAAQVWLVKTDSLGVLQWQRSYGNADEVEAGMNLLQTPDGGYIIGAYKYVDNVTSKVWVIKADSLGNLENSFLYGNPYFTRSMSLSAMPDGYLLGGIQYPDNGTFTFGQGYLLKINLDGTEQWHKTYKGATDMAFYRILPLPDGNIMVGGSGGYTNGSLDIEGLLYKMTASGDSLWARTYLYDSLAVHDYFFDIAHAPDGGFMCVGFADVSGTPDGQDAWVVRTDSLGNACEVSGCNSVGIAAPPPPNSTTPNIIYPNPASGVAYATAMPLGSELRLYDLHGVLQFQASIFEASAISLPPLASGIYIAHICTPDGNINTQKIVISNQ